MENAHKRLRIDPKSYALNRSSSVKRRRYSQPDCSSKSKQNGEPSALIFDSGAYTIKIGYSYMDKPSTIPNCIMKAKSERKRPFIGNQIEDCRDLSGLYYLLPCERGYITKWEVQKPVWDYVLQKYPIDDEPLIMTQPLYNFHSIQDCIDEIFFEEYDVKAMYRANTTDFARYEYVNMVKGADTNCIIIDSGYSFTHVVPYINGKKYYPGIMRISVGGKLLTNYLKDIISYRQLHVMEETYVINQVKEDACFMSADVKQDMRTALRPAEENTIVKNYVLPDFNNIRRGYIQEPGQHKSGLIEGCQILRLNNERFTVPELLIHPSNIGMESMGVAEAVVKCVLRCPASTRASLTENIVLIGGSSRFAGYEERLYTETRSLLPEQLPINIYKPDNGVIFPWFGGRTMSKDPSLQAMMVTKAEYEEFGTKLTYQRFNDWSTAEMNADDNSKEVEVKPARISLLDNLKGLNVFGKARDEVVRGVIPEQPKPEPSTSSAAVPEAAAAAAAPKKAPAPAENKVINVEIKNNKVFPANSFHIENLQTLQTGIQLYNGTTILPENLAIRFVPISEVCLNGTTFIAPANIKFV